MEFKKTKKNRMFGRVLTLVVALCLMFSLSTGVSAATENQAVTNAKNGVVQIQVWFYDQEAAVEHFLHSGTGFLINENTVVTCQHVATGFPDEWYVEWAQATNEALGGKRTAAQVKENLELRVSVYRDIYVKATVKKASTEMDYAILTLKETLSTRTPLSLRDSSQLNQTEEVFALGYPGDIASIEDANHYDADDVTITSGSVNKVGDMTFSTIEGNVYDSVNCVESSALITGGNSGGPLVDAEGNVVGINAVASDTRNIAISSKQLIDVLDALGIEYNISTTVPVFNPTSGEEPTEEVSVDTSELSSLIAEAESKDADVYTEESYEKMKEVLYEAKAALGSTAQAEIDVAADKLDDAINALAKAEDSSMNTFVLVGIIAAVVLVIVVLVVVIILSGKNKKSTPAPAPVAAAPVAKQPAPVRATTTTTTTTTTTPAASSETTVLSQGAGETTVLSSGAGETTVLSQAVNGGTLVRTSNNERIPICSADFSVGREKTKVDYCVGGNTNISRIHARFVVRDNVTYIVDNKAANGTFVNGVKARAGQEIEIKNGDTILLADEKFEFNK